MKKYFLLLTDFPNIVLLDEKTYALTYSELFSGELSMTCNNNAWSLYSLLIELNLLLANILGINAPV